MSAAQNRIHTLVSSGFGFYRAEDERRAIYENRFTGLMIAVDMQTGNYEPIAA